MKHYRGTSQDYDPFAGIPQEEIDDAMRPENRGRLQTRADLAREQAKELQADDLIRFDREAMEPDYGPDDY